MRFIWMPASFSICRARISCAEPAPKRRVADLAGMRLGVLHEAVEVVGRNGVGDGEAVVVFRDQRDRREVGELEARVLVERGVDRFEMRAEQQVVAVGRLRQHVARRQHAGGAGLVLDDEALAEQRAELVGDVPRRNVGRAAGAEADHEPHGAVRIVILRQRRQRRRERHEAQHRAARAICIRSFSRVRLLSEMAQKLLLIIEEFDAERIARPRQA